PATLHRLDVALALTGGEREALLAAAARPRGSTSSALTQADLPALKLAAAPTPLIGRADELAIIRQRRGGAGAEATRLLTLTGPAGVGKTRLALAAAALLADHFPEGTSVIDLALIRDPLLVLPAIARTLGLTETGHPPLPERLRDVLRERAATLL